MKWRGKSPPPRAVRPGARQTPRGARQTGKNGPPARPAGNGGYLPGSSHPAHHRGRPPQGSLQRNDRRSAGSPAGDRIRLTKVQHFFSLRGGPAAAPAPPQGPPPASPPPPARPARPSEQATSHHAPLSLFPSHHLLFPPPPPHSAAESTREPTLPTSSAPSLPRPPRRCILSPMPRGLPGKSPSPPPPPPRSLPCTTVPLPDRPVPSLNRSLPLKALGVTLTSGRRVTSCGCGAN